jgi:rhodanese-related sulfurtransferase
VVPETDLHTFAAAHRNGAYVVDVREPGEYVTGHVPGALLMPMAHVHARLAELPKGEPVYVICASGNRSKTAAGWMRTAGIDAVSVAGGTGGWVTHGHGVVRGVHPDEMAG